MSVAEAEAALARCCGARRWASGVAAQRPFGSGARLLEAARSVWSAMERADVLEAMQHHPRIGADLGALREKFAATESWSKGEQAAAAGADEETLRALRDGNVAYEARYGHIFLVCATGKSAAEMLELLRARMHNEADDELAIAAAQQMMITELRLAKLAEEKR